MWASSYDCTVHATDCVRWLDTPSMSGEVLVVFVMRGVGESTMYVWRLLLEPASLFVFFRWFYI